MVEENVPPAPPSDHNQVDTGCAWLSTAVVISAVVPAEATVAGTADAVTVSVCGGTGCTVSAVEAEVLIGVAPLHVAVTVSVTALLVVPVFGGAV